MSDIFIKQCFSFTLVSYSSHNKEALLLFAAVWGISLDNNFPKKKENWYYIQSASFL